MGVRCRPRFRRSVLLRKSDIARRRVPRWFSRVLGEAYDRRMGELARMLGCGKRWRGDAVVFPFQPHRRGSR